MMAYLSGSNPMNPESNAIQWNLQKALLLILNLLLKNAYLKIVGKFN